MTESTFEPHDLGAQMITNEKTGGAKQQKKARFDLIPPEVEWKLAELYGEGSTHYAERNWELGYDWSLSYAAARRHLAQFWAGEDVDPVTGAEHVISVAWHCMALSHFLGHPEYAQFDNRPVSAEIKSEPEEAVQYEQQELFPKTVKPCFSCDNPTDMDNCDMCYGLGIVDTK